MHHPFGMHPAHTLLSIENGFETKNIDATDFQYMKMIESDMHVCVAVCHAHNDAHIRLGKMICQKPLINCPEISSLKIARAPYHLSRHSS